MKKKLPTKIPIFPISGIIYFPKTNLPLNIFEPRYLKLVKDCMEKDKYMGLIQFKKYSDEVYKVGCLGKITEHKKMADGKVVINLTGISRFEILSEVNEKKLYREFEVTYDKFSVDTDLTNLKKVSDVEMKKLFEKTKTFFIKNGLLLNWNEFVKLDENQKINTLSMIAPISNEEKQKLLETVDINGKAKILSEIIEFYLYETETNRATIQ